MRIIAISDTHMRHQHLDIPDGDMLLHSGDLTNRGNIADIIQVNEWLGTLPHKYKIIIAGNHDLCFEDPKKMHRARQCITNAIYLQDSGVEIEGYKIWGSPWQPEFNNWAFNLPKGEALKEKWDLIPEDTGILLTHGPAYGILDRNREGFYCGCAELKKAIKRVKPKLHVFGHIHEGYGGRKIDGIYSVNASVTNRNYRLANSPVIIDL